MLVMVNGKISDSSRLGDLGLTLFRTTHKREKIAIVILKINFLGVHKKQHIESFTSLKGQIKYPCRKKFFFL